MGTGVSGDGFSFEQRGSFIHDSDDKLMIDDEVEDLSDDEFEDEDEEDDEEE